MKKEKAYPFLQAQNIYVRHLGLNAFVDCKRSVRAINRAIPHYSCLIFDFYVLRPVATGREPSTIYAKALLRLYFSAISTSLSCTPLFLQRQLFSRLDRPRISPVTRSFNCLLSPVINRPPSLLLSLSASALKTAAIVLPSSSSLSQQRSIIITQQNNNNTTIITQHII